jgi:hypothetical protein
MGKLCIFICLLSHPHCIWKLLYSKLKYNVFTSVSVYLSVIVIKSYNSACLLAPWLYDSVRTLASFMTDAHSSLLSCSSAFNLLM